MWVMPWGTFWDMLGRALLELVTNPLLYIGLLFSLWDLYRAGKLERRTFGIRVTHVWEGWLRRLGQAFVVGISVSVLCVLLGVVIAPRESWTVMGVGVILALFRVRFLAPLYAITLVTMGALWVQTGHRIPLGQTTVSRHVNHFLSAFHTTDWITLAGIALLAQAWLLWWNRKTPAGPAMVVGRRGLAMGGLLVQLAFTAPIVTLSPGKIPVPAWIPGWWPLVGVSGVGALVGLGFFAFPAVLGHAELWTTRFASEGISLVAKMSLIGAFILCAGAWAASRYSLLLLLIAALVVLSLQEGTYTYLHRSETYREPVLVPHMNGVRVLGVMAGSVASAMGLEPGELITHVNQIPIHTAYDLHFAFNQNPAYVKLRVIDKGGEPRLAGKPVFEGERHQLGLLLPPDHPDTTFLQGTKGGLLQTLYLRARKHRQQMGPLETDSTQTGRPGVQDVSPSGTSVTDTL